MAHEVESIVFVGQDITHEKQLEEEVRSQAETLKKQEKMLRDAEKELVSKLRDTRAELMGQFRETERIKNINEKTLEDMPDAVITTSSDNRIVFFTNPLNCSGRWNEKMCSSRISVFSFRKS